MFLGANLLKIVEGCCLPLVVGAAHLLIMLTWRRGARHSSDASLYFKIPNDRAIEVGTQVVI